MTKESVIDIVHKTIYGFFDIVEDDSEEPINEKDKLLLEVNKAVCNAIKDIPDDESRWIPVTERLPEEDGDYLVCIKGTVANINGDIQNFFKWLQDSWFLNWMDDCVIAWMPSPKQYEGE